MKKLKIIIAENSPVISNGLGVTIKNLREVYPVVIEVDTKKSLIDTVSSEEVDLLIVNPAFGGLLNPDEIRKTSLNSEIKIFAIEIGKLNKSVLSLYDDHLHVTDDLDEIRNKIMKVSKMKNHDGEEKENLSVREKEIISFVVKGLTNQEIADKLFLSVHTVMTHRRNIAKKLQIHSATGLTIYAIVNKIVDLSEIKL
ncbi:MAG: response regulator transcription factor [Muribaculaceae bacterium]|nr:response regulator transcription factor [Muribaculaceae bacterium]